MSSSSSSLCCQCGQGIGGLFSKQSKVPKLSFDELCHKISSKELKGWLQAYGISGTGCVEKSDYAKVILNTRLSESHLENFKRFASNLPIADPQPSPQASPADPIASMFKNIFNKPKSEERKDQKASTSSSASSSHRRPSQSTSQPTEPFDFASIVDGIASNAMGPFSDFVDRMMGGNQGVRPDVNFFFNGEESLAHQRNQQPPRNGHDHDHEEHHPHCPNHPAHQHQHHHHHNEYPFHAHHHDHHSHDHSHHSEPQQPEPQQQQQPIPFDILINLTPESIHNLSTKTLKQLLEYYRISTTHVVEKQELEEKFIRMIMNERMDRGLDVDSYHLFLSGRSSGGVENGQGGGGGSSPGGVATVDGGGGGSSGVGDGSRSPTTNDVQNTGVSTGSAGLDDNDLCKICYEQRSNAVLLECGHLCTCIDCSKKLKECPICRGYITRVVHTFRA